MFSLHKKINKSKQNNLSRVLLNSKAYFSMYNKTINLESIAENPEQNFYPDSQLVQEEAKSYEIEMGDMTMEEKNKSIVISEEASFLDFENRFVFLGFIDRINRYFYPTYLIFS